MFQHIRLLAAASPAMLRWLRTWLRRKRCSVPSLPGIDRSPCGWWLNLHRAEAPWLVDRDGRVHINDRKVVLRARS